MRISFFFFSQKLRITFECGLNSSAGCFRVNTVSQKCGKIQNEILQMSKKVREPQIGIPRMSKNAGNAGNWNSLNVKLQKYVNAK